MNRSTPVEGTASNLNYELRLQELEEVNYIIHLGKLLDVCNEWSIKSYRNPYPYMIQIVSQ